MEASILGEIIFKLTNHNKMEDQVFNNSVSARPTGMKYGLIWGAIGAVLLLVGYNLGWMDMEIGDNGQPVQNSASWISSLLGIGIAVAVIVMAINHHRDNLQRGFITFGQCVGVGFWTGLFAGLVSGVFAFLFFSFIAPDHFSEMTEALKSSFEDQGMGEDEIEMAMSMSSAFMSPVAMAVMSVIGSIIYGVIISLIAGIFLKKE